MPSSPWQQNSSNHSSTSSSNRSDSDRSCRSRSTAATDYGERPPLSQAETCYGRLEGRRVEYNPCKRFEDYDEPRSSSETYSSSLDDELDDSDYPEFQVPAYSHEVFPVDAIPTTPKDFGYLFPSTRRLCIRHDDATLDGNMNLRVDTQAETQSGRTQNFTLFHLRMHDLRSREFSLRRYCRESGREVCHSTRKYQKPASERPALQRSFSTAFATLRHKTESKPAAAAAGLKRADSGYGSVFHPDEEDEERQEAPGQVHGQSVPTNTIKLEFSNYAHVEVTRRGAKAKKRYEFEYWGTNYAWRRLSQGDGESGSTSFHLHAANSDQTLAEIVPIPLTAAQRRAEIASGGWIPPCYMKILDSSLVDTAPDVADVVVSSGLMALVDDCIKRHFHSKQTTQLHIPLTKRSSFKLNMEYVGPMRLIDEVFHRARATTSAPKPTPLRKTSV